RSPNRQSAGSARQKAVAGRERLHESEHAWLFQIRKFLAPKFPMVGRARRNHLSTAAPRHSAPGRHFLLHISLLVLHARHLSWRAPTDAIAARFHSRGFVFSTAGRRT